MKKTILPIDSRLAEIASALESNRALVLQAEPGAGKTTRVPAALLDGIAGREGEILVLEPRRLAAKMAAHRVAQERGEAIGQTVGYHFRFENVSSSATRLRFLTEGMLMRRMLDDPNLKGVSAVVLDEFHERHIHGDLALSLLRRLQVSGARKDLRILVMSATIQTGTLSKFLGDCPVIRVEGRTFEVALEYIPTSGAGSEAYLEGRVRSAVALARRDPVVKGGDILVFLPGMSEIRRAMEAISSHSSTESLLCLPLHGELSREEQDRAVLPGDRQKVILSTNVAETSLTIEGVTGVIDSGLHRRSSHSSWSGLPSLVTRPISRASAIQRAGRAGRMAPGKCFRLYSKGEYEARAPFESPEIQRAELSQTLLELASIGIANPAVFGWFERPSDTALASARTLLYRLGATGADGALLDLGRRMVSFPVHPRIARFLIEASRGGVASEGVELAAVLSEGRLEPGDLLEALGHGRGDFAVERMKERLRRAIGTVQSTRPSDAEKRSEALRKAVLRGFPDRVARKRDSAQLQSSQGPGQAKELVFASGGTARWEDRAWSVHSEYFVAVDAEERKGHGQARSFLQAKTVSSIEPDWLLDLDPAQVREESDCVIEGEKGRVEEISRLMYDQLVLSESRSRPQDPEKLGRLLARALLKKEGFLEKQESFAALQSRLRFLETHAPELGLQPLGAREIEEQLTIACWGKSTVSEALDVDLGEPARASLDSDKAKRLDQLAPDSVLIGRGRWAKISYEPGKPPWIESRLQDFFGLPKGPAVLGGRVPLTLHLLAPNYRAVQVTSDLEGFWVRDYPEVRKELSRRYPRHAWPENPRIELPKNVKSSSKG